MTPPDPMSPDARAEKRLILLVASQAPRSQRARDHLNRVLRAAHLEHLDVEQVDVLRRPHEALRLGVFATPALLWTDGATAGDVLYGDLSDEDALLAFLAGRS